jgi:hypothetical protein
MSADPISLYLSEKDVRAFSDLAKVVPKAAAAAQRRAINKTLGWLRTHIAKDVSKNERIALRAVRQRLRSYPITGSSKSGKLWFGVNLMDASRVGRPYEGKTSVSVAGRRYRGAFYQKVYGSKANIWIRKASKHFNAEDYPESEISSGGGVRSGWIAENGDRFPLAKAKVSWDSVDTHFYAWAKKADDRLLIILKQEMNFELHKYVKGTARA